MLSCHIPQILSCIVMSMYCKGLTCCEVAVKQHGFCLRSNCWAWSFCAASPLASPTSLFRALIDMIFQLICLPRSVWKSQKKDATEVENLTPMISGLLRVELARVGMIGVTIMYYKHSILQYYVVY